MKKIIGYLILNLLIFVLGNSFISAGQPTFDVSGYYKLFFTGFKLADYQIGSEDYSEPPIGAVNNRIRLKLSASFSGSLTFEAAYDFSPRIQDTLLSQENIFFGNIDPISYRVDDFNDRLYPGQGKAVSSFGIFHNLDRCFFTIKTSLADIFIGRQAIAWGSGRFVNPTDVIAPFAFNELDTEERRGVDALRVRVPLGMMDELDFGYIPGTDFKSENSAYYARGKLYLWKTDIAVLLMDFRKNLLVGVDVTRAIGGAGAWLEAAYVKPDFFVKDNEHSNNEGVATDPYFRASIGADYNFSERFYGFCEYHFNSAGKSKPSDYSELSATTAYAEGSTYLMGKHYLNLGMTYQLSPLIPLSGVVFVNLSDGSITVSPSVEYNIAENIYLGGGAYIGIGKKPEIIDLTTSLFRYHSEFGAYPAMFYTSLRVYF